MKFVLAKTVEKPMVEKPKVEIPTVEKKFIGPRLKEKLEVISQKSKGTSCEAFMSSLWCTRTYKAKLLQASGTQEG